MRSMPSDFTGSAGHGAESRQVCSRRHLSTQTVPTGFYGDISLLWKQLIAIAATYLFVAIVTYAIIKIVSIFLNSVPQRMKNHWASILRCTAKKRIKINLSGVMV